VNDDGENVMTKVPYKILQTMSLEDRTKQLPIYTAKHIR
jgi:hypothetical protein